MTRVAGQKPLIGERVDRTHFAVRDGGALFVFNEGGGTPRDLIGGRILTPVTAPTWSVAQPGLVRSYDGNLQSEYIAGGDGLQYSRVTVLAYLRIRSMTGTRYWIGKNGSANGGYLAYGLFNDGSATVRARFKIGAGATFLTINSGYTPDDLYHWYACTYDGATGRIYVDNVLKASATGGTALIYDAERGLTLGASNQGTTDQSPCDIAYCLVVPRALSVAEMGAIIRDPYAMVVRRRGAVVAGTTPISTSDTSTATDAASVSASATQADTGSSADSATVAASLTQSDSASTLDATSISVALTSADTVSAADTTTTAVALTVADTVTASEGVSIAQGYVVSVADSVSAADSAAVAASLTVADTAVATDAATINAGATPSTSDTAMATEATSLGVTSVVADSVVATETVTILARLTLQDVAMLSEGVQVAEQGIQVPVRRFIARPQPLHFIARPQRRRFP